MTTHMRSLPLHELPAIAEFAREWTSKAFRYDPMLHLRYDGNPSRNLEITAERLDPGEIAALERRDPERFEALKKGCDILIRPESAHLPSREEIRDEVRKLMTTLLSKRIRPAVVTISRSCHSGYCPKEYAEFIESELLSALRALPGLH